MSTMEPVEGASSPSSNLTILSGLVERLNELKSPPDKEFSQPPDPDLENRIEELIIESEAKFFELKDSIPEKGEYWLLLGRLYSCGAAKWRPQALEALVTAVKLDNTRIQAWNELGEVYWYDLNIDMAKQCFQRAIEQNENKVSLRNLSIVLRKGALDERPEEKKQILSEATQLAKKAVQLDPNDGLSWSILGNAYLAEFFGGLHNFQYAAQAIRAYKQAEKTLEPNKNFELFYNKGIALKYMEDYECALESLLEATRHAGSWSLPQLAYRQLAAYLDAIHVHYGKKGKLKAKRFWSLVNDLKNPSFLGSYENNPKFSPVTFQDLSSGGNPGKFVFGRVLWSVQFDSTFPFTMGLVDLNAQEVVVTVFNLNSQSGFLIGDSVLIPNPDFEELNLKHLDKDYQFKKIRVSFPSEILLNGKKLSASFFAATKFQTSPV